MIDYLLLAAEPPAAAPAGGGLMSMLIMIAPMFIIFYLVAIKPQQKRQKQKQEMLKSLKVGDKIITIGGIHGEVARVSEDGLVSVKICDKVKIDVSQAAIDVIQRSAEEA